MEKAWSKRGRSVCDSYRYNLQDLGRKDRKGIQGIQRAQKRKSSGQHDKQGACPEYACRAFHKRNFRIKKSAEFWRAYTKCDGRRNNRQNARVELEQKTGKKVVTPLNAKD